jgi:hypothetical protein
MIMNTSIVTVWQRLPVIVRAVIAGLAVLMAGERPWGGIPGHAALAGWNERVFINSGSRCDISGIVRRQAGTGEQENAQIVQRCAAEGG